VQPYSSEIIRSCASFSKILSTENNILIIYYEECIVVGTLFMLADVPLCCNRVLEDFIGDFEELYLLNINMTQLSIIENVQKLSELNVKT
jgi:hypothetical protein